MGLPNSLTYLAALALAMLLLVSHAGSQQRKPDDGLTPTIQVEVNVVNILATVRDKHGAFVKNLTKDDFILTEHHQPQQIKYFEHETDVPLTIGLLIDVSGSQSGLVDIERQAASQFFSQVLREGDVAFLIRFSGDVELLQDITGSPRVLQAALQGQGVSSGGSPQPSPVVLTVSSGGTALYDAVYVAARERFMHRAGRKAMVLITDGIDFGSDRTLADAIKTAQQADTVIYSIRYFDLGAYVDNSFQVYTQVMDSALRTMSEETGGRVFYVDKKHPLPQVFDELQQEMRSQYAISYAPTTEKLDGSYRRVNLRMRDHNLKVQARKGYYAIPSRK
jgi:VWFA-related protein